MDDYHYHDGYSNEHMKEIAEIHKWQRAGFSNVHSGRDHLQCNTCGALVGEEAWRKHKKYHEKH